MSDPRNPAGSYTPSTALATVGSETAGQVLAAQAKALVEARFTVALRNQRDIDVVRQKLLRECERPSFAEVAIYHKPIGDGIEGPSIRFAEAALQAMGNIAVDCPAIYDDSDKRILRVTVADMETNVTHSKDVTITKTVERSFVRDGDEIIRARKNKKGKDVYIRRASDDEILTMEGALVSKALRTVGLRLIPGWLVDECMRKVYEVREKGEKAEDPDARRKKLFDFFASVDVTADQVKEWIGHDGELTEKERRTLYGLYTAIKDGEATWREVMDARWEQLLAEQAKRADAASRAVTGQAMASLPPADPKTAAADLIRSAEAAQSDPKKGAAAVKSAIKRNSVAPPAPAQSSPAAVPPAAAPEPPKEQPKDEFDQVPSQASLLPRESGSDDSW